MNPELTESLEDYLETIYNIIEQKGGVRVKDIAENMNVKNSSVTSALKALETSGYVNYVPYGVISLTDKGNELSKNIVKRHATFKFFLEEVLDVEENLANETACRMEHSMPKEVFKKFTVFIDYIKDSYGDDENLLDEFRKYCKL